MSAQAIPGFVRSLSLGDRVRWARKASGLSHDRLVEKMGRSNRSHLIKIEQGKHIPSVALREAIADATGVPRDLLVSDDDEEADPAMAEALMAMVKLVVRAEMAKARP